MPVASHTIKTEVYDINNDNVVEKLSEHFGYICEFLVINKIENIRVITKIDQIGGLDKATISSEIMERIHKLRK